jgi:HEAT repeat protein
MNFFAALLLGAVLQAPSLESTNHRTRIAAVEELSRPGRTENVAPLAEALRKEARTDVRIAIVSGLATINVPEVIPVLIETLRSDLEKDVRLRVIDSMQRLYIPVAETGALENLFNRVKSAFTDPDRPVVRDEKAVDTRIKTALSETMQKDFVEQVRAAAAAALGTLRARDQVGVMIATLDSPQSRDYPEVRLAIVSSLGLIRDKAAGPALEKAIRDSDPDVKLSAIVGVGLVGHTEARQLIENIFKTENNREVKRRSLESLSVMRDARSRPFFESLLAHSDAYYREVSAEGLARIEHDGSMLLERYNQEKQANVRNALAYGLATAGHNQYIGDLARALNSRQSEQATLYLFELGKFEGKLSELHRYLQDSSPVVRGSMVRIIGDIGDPSSRPYVENLTRDSDPNVVRDAIAALRTLTLK